MNRDRKHKSKWHPRMDRYTRMREAWIDILASGTKISFTDFEQRMLANDILTRKNEYNKRRMVFTSPIAVRAIKETLHGDLVPV